MARATRADAEPDERAQQTATDYAVTQVRALLISGALAPGTRDDQAKLAAGLGVSFLAGTHCADEVAAGKLRAISLGPDHMVRQLSLIHI